MTYAAIAWLILTVAYVIGRERKVYSLLEERNSAQGRLIRVEAEHIDLEQQLEVETADRHQLLVQLQKAKAQSTTNALRYEGTIKRLGEEVHELEGVLHETAHRGAGAALLGRVLSQGDSPGTPDSGSGGDEGDGT